MSRIVTQTDFIARSRAVHGDRYDYSKAVYTGANKKLTIICAAHGPFEQAPSNHYAGKGCRACSGLLPHALDSFVEKSRAVHGIKYDYSRAVLGNGAEKVTIGCPLHGEFEQAPSKHLAGNGCPQCGIERVANGQRGTVESFIEKAQVVHGEKYDYSLIDYRSTHMKVNIICRSHGPFEQTPAAHQSGAGCPSCAGVQKMTTQSFIIRAQARHGDRFSYERTVCTNATRKLTVTCRIHGDFKVNPHVHLDEKGRGGCKTCMANQLSQRFALGTEGFVAKARALHGDKYDYSRVDYVNKETNLVIGCPEHGEFEQRGGVHLMGGGCPACSYVTRAGKTRLTQNEFLTRAREVHGDRYDYSRVVYSGTNAYVTIGCPKHGPFEQNSNSHMQGTGCPGCADHGFDPNLPAVVYVLAIEGRADAFTGYGITGNLDTRLRTHRKKLAAAGFEIRRKHVAEFARGHDALAVEELIQQRFDLLRQVVDGFRTEATHISHFDDLVELLRELNS